METATPSGAVLFDTECLVLPIADLPHLGDRCREPSLVNFSKRPNPEVQKFWLKVRNVL
jgi:hypothetical protein